MIIPMSATLLPPNSNSALADNDNDDDGCLLEIPRAAHTLAGFRRWALSDEVPDKLPLTFIRGKVYVDMAKEEIRTHALVKTAVGGSVFNGNEEVDFGHLFINGVLVTNETAEVSNNPDLVGISWESLDSGRVRYVQRKNREVEIVGSPDLALEIVSDSSVTKDLVWLREAYHRAEIAEYWIIDARGDEIVFHILHWRKAGYVAAPTKDGWAKSRVMNQSLRLTPKPDRRGSWKYTLERK